MKKIIPYILISIIPILPLAGSGGDSNSATLHTLGKSHWFVPSILFEIETMPSHAAGVRDMHVSVATSVLTERFSLGEPYPEYPRGDVFQLSVVPPEYPDRYSFREFYRADMRYVLPLTSRTVAGSRFLFGADVDGFRGYSYFGGPIYLDVYAPFQPEFNSFKSTGTGFLFESFAAYRYTDNLHLGVSIRASTILFRDITTEIQQFASYMVPSESSPENFGISASMTAFTGNFQISTGITFDRMLQTVSYRYKQTGWWGCYDCPIPLHNAGSIENVIYPQYSHNQRERHSIGRIHSLLRYSLTDNILITARAVVRGQWSSFGELSPYQVYKEKIRIRRPIEDIRAGLMYSNQSYRFTVGLSLSDFKFQRVSQNIYYPSERYVYDDQHWLNLRVHGGYEKSFFSGRLWVGTGIIFQAANLIKENELYDVINESVFPMLGVRYNFGEKISVTLDASDNEALNALSIIGRVHSRYSFRTGVDVKI